MFCSYCLPQLIIRMHPPPWMLPCSATQDGQQLSLSQLPAVLVVTLKRFNKEGNKVEKEVREIL